MIMKYLFANGLIILSNYLHFLVSLFKFRKSEYVASILTYSLYAYAFYLLGGYAGVIFYTLCALNIFVQLFNKNNSVLLKFTYTIIIAVFYIFAKDYSLVNNLPFIVLVSMFWIKPYFKFLNENILEFIENILMIIYSYKYRLYLLALYETYKVCFGFVTKGLRKLVDFTDSRTS